MSAADAAPRPRRSRGRWLLWPLLALALLLGAGAALLESAWLRDRVVAAVLDRVAERWAIEELEGRLTGALRLEGLHLERKGLVIDADALVLRAAPWRLLRGEAALAEVTARALAITVTPVPGPPPEPAGPFAFTSPLPLAVDALLLDGAQLALPGREPVVLRRLEARARLREDRLELDRLSVDAPRYGQLVGDGTLTLAPELPFRAALAATVRDERVPEDLRPLALELRAEGERSRYAGTLALAAPLGSGLDLDGSFELALDPEAVWGLAGTAELRLAESIELDARRLEGAGLVVEADRAGLAWRLAARAEGLVPKPLSLGAQGRLGPDALEVASLALVTGIARLEADGRLALGAPRAFTARVDATHLDAAALGPEGALRASELAVSTRMEGELDARRLRTRDLAVTGRWNGEPVSLEGELLAALTERGPRIELEDLDATVGENRLLGTLRYRDALAVDLSVDAPALEALWPTLAGRLSGSVRARGAVDAPELRVDLAATNLALRGTGPAADRIALNGTLALGGGAETGVTLAVTGLRPQPGAEGAALDGEAVITGTWPALQAELSARSDGTRVEGTLATTLPAVQDATVRRLALELPVLGRWRLDGPVGVRRDGATVAFDGACLRRGSGSAPPRLCWEGGSAGPDAVSLEARLEDLPTASLEPWLPPAVALGGTLAGSVTVEDGRLQLETRVDEGRVTVQATEDDPVFEDRFDVLFLRVAGTRERLDARLEIVGGLVGRTSVTSSLAPVAADGALDVDARLALEDLSPLGLLAPQLRDTRGAVGGRIRVGGTPQAPEVGGSLTLAGGTTVLPLGVRLDPLVARVEGTGTDTARIEVEATSEGRVLSLVGDLARGPEGGPRFEGRLTGEAVRVLAQPQLSVTASPELDLLVAPDRIAVTGAVAIPGAFAEFRRLPEGDGVTLSDDVVLHGEDAPGTTTARNLSLDVAVTLGDDVRLAAGPLEARLGGAVTVTRRQPEGLRVRGRIRTVEGGMKGYGQTLRIRRGELAFDGPADNPGVELVAVREVEGTEVGLRVTGTLQDLRSDLYSSPPMEDATILSMLVTGRRPGEGAGTDARSLEAAALNLGIGRAAPVIDQLAGQLGIDEVALDNPLDERSGAIVVGKEISRNLYARYTYGLHSRIGGLVLEYRLTDEWMIRSETGLSQSVDVVYRREFD
ncbi:MAG: translocation/assembly module TamB domain-containing protein [Pseudomonadales bacterium]|jgi:translocation and assembly module TamB|nr:translocation/assembly module TamB domain-containing protein [Pseudomonadales bacterium]